jgi:hypothetical protein
MNDVLYTLPIVDVLLNVSDSHEEFESALAEFKKLAKEQGAKFMEEVMLPKTTEGNRIRDARRRTYYDLSFTVQLLRVAVYELEKEMWDNAERETAEKEAEEENDERDYGLEDPDDSGS